MRAASTHQRSYCALLAAAVLLWMSAYWPTAARADGEFVITPPPQTGAYQAEFVEDRGHVSIIDFSGNYDSELAGGSLNSEARAVVAKEFYRTHEDEYDFLVAFSAFEFDTGDAVAFHMGIQNEVKGIGVPIFDHSAEFGSDGKLQGYIDMAALSRYEVDPLNPDFEFLLGVLSHEILHQWAAKVRFENPDGSLDEGLLGKDNAHWSYLLDSNASVEYGARWRDNGDGTFTATVVRKFFSPLDLYLMGVYRADEVPPFTLIENPDIDKTQLPRENDTIEGVARLISIEDIIAAEGERVPGAADAQKEFRIGFILLKGATQQIPNHYYVALDNIRQAYSQRFAIATGGRALVQVYPQAVYANRSGAPTEISGGEVRPGLSIEDGLTWLREQQYADGYWEDKGSTRIRDTTYSLLTLLRFDANFANSVTAIEWINAQLATNTDFLARQVALFGNNPIQATLDQLLALQNSGGGWGLAQGYDSDALDTALAILALRKASVSPAAINQAVQFLLLSQNADGGWGNAVDSESRSGITATVLQAIQPSVSATAAIEDALALLQLRQNSDGGFGDSPSTIYDTAMVLQVFMDFDRVDQIEAEAAAIYLFSLQTDDGSWGGSTYATALAITALKRFNFANWQLTPQLTIEPAAPRDGDRVRLVITITNDSSLFTPQASLVVYDGNPFDGGVPIGGSIPIPIMAPGTTVTLTQYWDSFDQTGEHELVAVADPDGLFTELSENDNLGSVEVTVESAPDGIDLSVIETDIAVLPVRPNRLPSTMGFVANIRNSGLTDATDVRVVLLKESATSAASIVDEMVVNVPNRSSIGVNFSDALEEPGETLYSVVIDPDDNIVEVSETNNSAQVSVTTNASVDLEIRAVDIGSDVNPAIFGEALNFQVKIHNRGTQDTPTTQVRYVVSNGTDSRELASNNVQLTAAQTIEQTINWQVDLTGTLKFTAEVDFDALVTELDETNNLATISLPVESRNGANLIVSHNDLGFSPEIADEGGSVNLAAAILNNGNLAAGSFDVAFYLGDPDAGGTQIGAVQRVDGLEPGNHAFVMADWQPVRSAGDKLIFVVADIDNVVPESKVEDNRAFNVLSVVSLPDLAVSDGDIGLEPQFPSAGSAVTFSVTVSNLGDQSASDILVRLYEGEPDSGGQLVGEQSIPGLDGDAAESLSFAVTLGDATTVRSFVVQVDPHSDVLERDRSNNSARKDVAVQRGDIHASNLYLSPNADGVQDATEVSFILQEPMDVVLQVVDVRDKVIREFREQLINIEQGSAVWDGLDGKGRLVVDGDYRLRLVKVDGSYLAEVLVQVDTNRSSLLLAVNSEFEFYNNLTCELDTVYAINALESEEQLVIEAGDNDIFNLNINGSEARAIIPSDWFGATEPYYTQTSNDGSLIAFTRYASSAPSYRNSPLWVSDGEGENLREIYPDIDDGWVLRDDGEKIYLVEYSAVYSLDVETGVEQFLYENEDEFKVEPFSLRQQPGGSMLLFIDSAYEDSGPSVILVDGEDPAFGHRYLAYNWRNEDENLPHAEWSADGSKIVVTSDGDGAVFVYDNQGVELARIDSPAGPRNAELDYPVWSSTGAEIALTIRANADDTSGIYLIDLDDNSINKVANFAAGESGDELASYHISTWSGSDWVERGVLHYRRFFREQQLDLSDYLPDVDGEYKVRIRQIGKEAAHVESVALLSGKRRAIPSSAVKLEKSMFASLMEMISDSPRGEEALASVSHNDYEVLDLFESEIQVEWQDVARTGQVILALNAREEALSKLKTLPFTYAGRDDSGFPYLLAPNAAIKVDGDLNADDGFDVPLFKHFSRPGTGHPSATVNGYVGSDNEYLYGALDFTVDNTMDGDLDWASMRVQSAQGWREFRVTEKDNRYGLVNFTRTPAVAFTHKYYEFRIPLSELEKLPGDSVVVSFQGYGTAAIVVDENNALPLDGRLRWPAGDRALFYDAYGEGKWAIFLNNNNHIKEVFSDWPGDSGDIIDPFFLDSGRKLLFLSDRAVNDPASICYQKGTDLWSYESLLNLVVDLRATRSNSAGGIILSGTVSDLNFERYTLEYASQAASDSWYPIFNGAATQVVDARFTTWAPPAVDKYLVRLTAYDRAGNSRSVTRRASWGLNSSITDLGLTPEYISPNGDGVQDEASLHYRVLEPVHLDFSVFNEQGDVVRSFARDHSLIGTEHDLTWDGRNNLGLAVVDGRYRIAVLGFEFFVNVDSTAPEIVSMEIENARQKFGIGEDTSIDSAPGLNWAIAESNQYSIEIETGDGATPDLWRPFAQPIVRDDLPETIEIDESDLSLTLAQFVDRSFRMRVTDVAGNVTTLTLPPGEQELILKGLVVEEFQALKERDFNLDESLIAPVALAFVEYREQGGSGAWQEVAIDSVSIVNESFSFNGLPPNAGPGKRFDMRIKAIDFNDQVFYSNIKQLVFANVLEELLGGLNKFTTALSQSATLNGLDTEGQFSLAATSASNKQIVIESVQITLSSNTDPRYVEPVELVYIEEDFELAPGAFWPIAYQAPNLTGCLKYKTVADVTFRVIDTTGETPTIRNFISSWSSINPDGNEAETQLPCLSISASVTYAPAQSCSAQLENNVEITLTPNAGNEFGLKLLTLYTQDGSGAKNVFYNVNKPVSGQTYRYPVDGAGHVEGVQNFYAELTNDANQQWTESIPLLIDRTQPATAIHYPQEDQLVCAIPRQKPDGGFESVVNIDVEIDDPTGDRSQEDPLSPFEDELAVEMQYTHNASSVKHSLLLERGNWKGNRYETEHAVQGRLAELVNANGDYSLFMQATDKAGNQQCLVRNFAVDGIVEHEPLRTDYTLFSPNDDGELDSLDISVGVDEPVSLDISVYATKIDTSGDEVKSGDAIRHLANQLQLLPGSELLSWDGRAAGGQVVADGLYILEFDYRDACGNRSKRQLFATVDATAPDASIDYPRVDDPLTSILEVLTSVDDVHLKQFTLELGQGTDPDRWLELGAGTRPFDNEVIAIWNTVHLVGPYTLRLTASDNAGNVSESIASLSLLERSSLFDYFEVLPLLISPNQDNRRETAGVRVGLASESLVTVNILDQNELIIHNLAQDRIFAADALNLSWDGKNNAGETVADGTYQVELIVLLASNTAVKQTESLTLVVDSSAPQISISRPRSIANGASSVIGSISDTHLLHYEIFLTSTPQAPQWNSVVDGNRNQFQQSLASLGELDEGDYALRVVGTDEGEIVSEEIIAFSVDNTPPELAILAPEADSFIGGNPEAAALSIEVLDDNIETWMLNIGAGDSPETWTELISGSELPLTNPVATLETASYADGSYTLQLTAIDAAGNQSTINRSIQIDNSAPLAEIVTPTDNSYVTAPIEITGNASDANLHHYRLDISPGSLDDASQWSQIGEGDAQVIHSILLNWRSLPPDGSYILRLMVQDKAENIGSAKIALVVDTTPPAAPANLDGVIEASSTARIYWPAGEEADIAGYRVYRDGVEISIDLVETIEYRDENLADGRYRYTIRAEDYAGWLSEPSNEIELLLDTTPPNTKIFSPRDGSVTSGIVELRGSANSPDDFREYRIYLDQDSGWQLLEQSPVPIVADTLYQLDTTNFAEGASYSLKLEAEDINGNVGEAVVNLTVDNEAPLAPTGLIAIGDDINVNLAWNPNSETDLLGYLLFRGDQIANADGVVIGDLRPFALPSTNFNDLALADGLYAYTVAAIDQAGNISEHSLASEILIDTRPPVAVIATPADGGRFDTTQYVTAVSDATDIAQVQFQYKPAGGNEWLDLAPADASEPFSSSLDPLALNFAQGPYQLRAVATDTGNKIDPAPAAILVYYTDVSRPDAVSGLIAHAQGSDVLLSWDASSDSDLAGYLVDRIDEDDEVTRLTDTLLTDITLTDPVIADGIYHYRVMAQDTNANISDASNTATARVHTPLLRQPYTPVELPGSVELTGRGVELSTVSGVISNIEGEQDLPEASADGFGSFTLPVPGLALGDNLFTVNLTDSFGNVSKPASVKVTHGLAPAQPTGLAAEVPGYDVNLSWNVNSEADLLGYRVYRDDNVLLGNYPARIISADASVNSGAANRVLNSSRYSYWYLATSSQLTSDPEWLSLTFEQAELVTSVELDWYLSTYRVLDYDVEARFGDLWVTLKRVRDSSFTRQQVIELDTPYYTDQIRLRMLRAYSTESDRYLPVRLSSVRVKALEVLPSPSYRDVHYDGEFNYQVSAVNTFGFESPLSQELLVGIGDVTAPDEVILSAEVVESDVNLDWLASASDDVYRYEVFRDGSLLAELYASDLSYLDVGLANANYAYVVYAIDYQGLRSMASNQVEVTVAIDAIEAPEFVSVTVVPDGASLDLLWQELNDGQQHYYRVFRAQQPAGPYTTVAEVLGDHWRDRGLANGITYYYRIAALDESGNEGLQSRELSAVPLDEVKPVTVMLAPGAGKPHVVSAPRVDIFGQSEAGAQIRLLHDGIPTLEVVSDSVDEYQAYPIYASYRSGSLSPDGKYLIQVMASGSIFTNLENGSKRSFNTRVNHDRFYWSDDGSHTAYSRLINYRGNYLHYAYARSVLRYEYLLTSPYLGESFDYPVLSSDASRFAAIGRTSSNGVYGLWLKSRNADDWRLLKAGNSIQGESLQWSPDDRYLAYRTLDSSRYYRQLEIIDLLSGDIVVIDDLADQLSNLYWSADSGSLLYSRKEDSASNIWKYDLESGLSEALTTGADNDFSDPHEFIGTSRLMAVSGGTALVSIDLDRQVVDSLYQSQGIKRGSLHKARTGEFAFVELTSAELIRFTPAGRFQFNDVPLRLGDNVFTSTASDASTEAVASVNALTITQDLSNKQDLVIEDGDISIVPAILQSGRPATVQVEFSSRGPYRIYAPALTLVATDANGFSQVLIGNAQFNYINAGDRASISVNWTPSQAGTYRLLAIVDPDQLIDEAYETNNSTSKSVLVVVGAEPVLNLSTGRAFYGADEEIITSLDLFNAGDEFSGYLEVIIEDQLGFSVDRIAMQQPVELAYGASARRQYSWNSAAIFAGGYRVHVYLYSNEQVLIADQIAEFDIGETRGFSSQVFSDLKTYLGNSDVLISSSVNYGAGNALFDGALAHLQIVDANAVIVAQQEYVLGTMLQGDIQSFNLRWNTALSGPGDYAIQFDVTRDQQLVTQAVGGFSVIFGANSLEGELSMQNDAPAAGEVQTVLLEVSNANNLALNQLPVRVRLIDPGEQSVLQDLQWIFDIAPGATASASAEFHTEDLQLKTYSLLLEALLDDTSVSAEFDTEDLQLKTYSLPLETLVDDASGDVWVNLASADFSLRDRNPPTLQVLRPRVNGYLRGDADILVAAVDDLSFIDLVEVRIDAGAWQAMALADAGTGEYKVALAGLDEGVHSLQARATDAWDNSAESELVDFTIDNTAPVIDVTGVANAGIYNSAVTPMVAIGEAYPGTVYITRSGLPFVSGEAVANDGSYQFEIYAADLAGNESQLFIRFDIDQLAPLVEVSGLVDGTAYAADVTPSIRISDANLQSQQISLNGQSYISATPIVAEGEYILVAIGIDTAGNSTRVEYQFSIDRTPPTILISGVADQVHYNSDVAASVDIIDAGQYDASITLNGQPYNSDELISAAGSYQLAMTASDAAGNSASEAIAFVIDRTAPVIGIGGVIDNGFYRNVTPQISVTEDNLDTLSITLDDVDYVSQAPINSEGGHLLRITATDRAGNESAREVFFTIDFTPPLVSVDTPLHGETLFTRNTDVVGQTEPFVTVYLQIGEVGFNTQSDANGDFEFSGVVLDQGFNTLLLNAVDRATNEGPVVEIFVQVVSGNIPGEYGSPGGILVWSAHKNNNCKVSAKSRKSQKTMKSQKSMKPSVSICHEHEPGEMLEHEGEPTLAVIDQALADERRDYLLVHNEDDFLEAMRSQRFGVLLLLDLHKDYCGKYDNSCDSKGHEHDELKVSKDARNEIQAMVASGTGLVWIKTRAGHGKDWESLTGVKVKGALNDVNAIEILPNSIATAGQIAYSGRALTLEIKTALVSAVGQSQGTPMIVTNDYAGGRVVVLGFNPAAASDGDTAASLLNGIFIYAAPSTSSLSVNGVAEIAWLVEDVALDTPLELRANLPLALQFLHAADATLSDGVDETIWQRDYAVDDNRFFALIRLAQNAGTYEVDATLSQLENGQSFVLNTSQLSLTIEDRFAETREQLIASVAAIETSKKAKSSKHDKNAIKKIQKLLDGAFEHDPATASLDNIEVSIDALLEVIYEVEKKGLSAEPITHQVGDVLRFYQSVWHRQVFAGELN
jgi:subtilase family serine protease/flagellar hook assembly protein FlgD/squalene cyclase